MPGDIRAVIDIGTNSVKLLVAEVLGDAVRPLHESSHQTRLGQGFYETRLLRAPAIEDTARAVAEFAAEARAWNPASIRVIATSAARDALNQADLLRAIESAAGLPATVISGAQEADWAFRGVASDPLLARANLLVMDVGGGSTEFILGRAGQRLFGGSFPLGSVRLLESLPISDPPTAENLRACERHVAELLASSIQPRLAPELARLGAVQLVATGGASTILARVRFRLSGFERERIEGAILTRESIREEKIRLWSLPLAERKSIIGLPANRADVILPGVVIFDQLMECLALPSLRVSTRGIRFAALMDGG